MINALNLNKHIKYINARSNNLITTNCALICKANYRKKEKKGGPFAYLVYGGDFGVFLLSFFHLGNSKKDEVCSIYLKKKFPSKICFLSLF
jgi:hypothetical protein